MPLRLSILVTLLTALSSVAASLKEISPFPIGVGISDRIHASPADWPLLKTHFAFVTPENSMKPDPVQRQPGQWNFNVPDAFVAFALTNNLKVVGHCLVWAKDDRTPPWFGDDNGKPASREVLLARMKTHIDTLAGRYRGKIAQWDVVNEALDDGTNFLRPSLWTRACGEEFIAKAFEYAHAADPNALLIYNDYNNELPNKFPKMLRLIESLRAQKVPIHAIGLQGHYELDSVPFEQIEKTLAAMQRIGMKVVVSELDIDVIPRARWWANNGAEREALAKVNPYKDGCPPEILARQADQYAKLFAIFKKYSDTILRISFWNLHDGQSWLNDFPWQRVNHPLLFDRDRKPKPAFDAVVRELSETLFKAEPHTPAGAFTEGIEGPACDRDGNIYAVNFAKQQTIGRTTPDGKSEIFVTLPSDSVGNGIVFDRAGFMYVADYTGHNVLRIEPATRGVQVLASNMKMNQPNDLAIGPDETLYASDPNWKAGTGQIWRIDRDGTTTLLAADLGTSNGIEVSPDGKSLYLNESVQRNVWAWDITPEKTLANKRLIRRFDDFGFDGMRCDVDGNLYITRHSKGTVIKMTPAGEILREIDVLGKKPSNLCFGGPDGRTVYVTEVEHTRLVKFRADRPGLAWSRAQRN